MKFIKRALALALTLALLAVPLAVFFRAQALVDWWELRGYTPPPAIVQLAGQDTMTAYAVHVFYVNHPDLETDASQFRSDCNETEQTIVLGCYHGNQAGIFIYNVTDPRLAGVQQVTAAHEMLHAAYDRLSSKDRADVDNLLENYYANGLKDQRIIDTINSYKQTEPNDVVDEMHSVFGTEASNLPLPLENYYKKYFTNRGAVVAYANSYESEFTTRENELKAANARLATMKSVIDQEEADLQSRLRQIDQYRARLDAERSSDVRQYNSDVPGFNAEVASYNSAVDRLRSNINAYNALVDQTQSIAQELASLNQAIDTRQIPQTVQ